MTMRKVYKLLSPSGNISLQTVTLKIKCSKHNRKYTKIKPYM